MSSLRPGVILKLLESTNQVSQNGTLTLTGHLEPAILQVTGITPAIAGPDLFSGHRGFYLRLSDLSHSSYFSLLPEHDDLILADRLHLGQLVQINCLKPAVPVPILHDFHLLPTRFPCLKDTTDLTVPNPNSESQSTDIKEVIYPRPPLSPSIKSHIPRSISASAKTWSIPSSPENSILKKKELERRSSEVLSELRKFSVTCADDHDSGNDSDESSRSRFSSCTSSSHSSSSSLVVNLKSMRKSWDDSESVKENKPTHSRSRSASLSPNRLAPQRSISKTMMPNEIIANRRKTERVFNVLGNYSKRKQLCPVPIKPTREIISSLTSSPFCAMNNSKWPNCNIAWGSLSLGLSKHGKDALKHRDSALQSALDSLLEASASEKLIQCLSAYGEIQSDKDDDPKDLIDRFLKFHRDLDQAIQIIQPMATHKQVNKTVSKLASERKQCAYSWIKVALKSNLTKYPHQTSLSPLSSKEKDEPVINESKLINPVACCHKPKLRKNVENSSEPNTFLAVIELSIALRYESTRWFLKYVEKFLDAVEACESHVGGLLCQMKKLDDWLNEIVKKEKVVLLVDRNKDGPMLSEEEENEACERVRKKIYGVLLRHVESAAVALESMSATDEEKEIE